MIRGRATRSRGMVVAVSIVVLTLVALMVTSILNAVVADRTLEAASADSYAYVGDLMSERVATFAGAASDVVEGTASELERHGGAMSDEDLLRALTDRLEREPAVGSIFVATPDGHLTAVAGVEPTGLAAAEDGDAAYTRLLVTPQEGGGSSLVTTRYTEDLEELDTTEAAIEYSVIARAWYQDALANDGVTWTEPYVSARNGEIVVSPVTSVTADGVTAAVVGADLDLDLLGALLEDIPLGSDARAFILTGDGRVVAAPAGAREELRRILGTTDSAPSAADFDLPTVAPTALDQAGEAIRERGDTVSLEREMDADTGLDWILHLEASAEDLTPSINDFQRTAVWVTSLSILMVIVAAVVALRLWRPIRTLRVRAATDALTGLANRYEYARRLRAMLRTAEQSGETILLIALDLDDFKQVNDDHGHDAGDVVLAAVGDSLRASVRQRDLAARVGGDEFVVVMRVSERASAVELARRLRDDVALAILESFHGASGVGATAGFATTATTGYDAHTLQTAADDALVAGKRVRKGRTYAFGHVAGTAGTAGDGAPRDDAGETSRPADSLPGN